MCIYIYIHAEVLWRFIEVYILFLDLCVAEVSKNRKRKKIFEVRGVKERSRTGSSFLSPLFPLLFSSPPPVATSQTADSSAVFINTLQTITSFGDPPVNVVPPPGIWSGTCLEIGGIVWR